MSDGSLIAPVESTRTATTGLWLVEGAQGLVGALQSESWVDPLLAGATFGLSVAATVIDPFGALLSNGFGWMMEHFEPLRQILDQLTGMPDVVAAHAATWENMANELFAISEDLSADLSRDLPDWQGAESDAYHTLMGHNVEGIAGLGGLCAAMATATQAAGNLVLFTREVVRELIADLVAQAVSVLLKAIGIVTIPWAVAQVVVMITKWAGRILSFVMALVTSLTNLTRLLNG